MIAHVFVMMGAVPNTGWLEGCIVLDSKGFIKTGPDLSPEELVSAHQPLTRRPYLLETSLPGVLAAGDVRGSNVKRVASAVGEGSIAISFVHQLLREQPRRSPIKEMMVNLIAGASNTGIMLFPKANTARGR